MRSPAINDTSQKRLDQAAQVLAKYPDLDVAGDDDISRLLGSGQEVRVPVGAHAFHKGDECRNFIFVLDGQVRVQLSSEGGREVVLYRVRPGGSCAITTSCLIGGELYPAEAIIEEDVVAVMIPDSEFRAALAGSEVFRHFVFHGFSDRLCKVIGRVEAVTLKTIGERLAMQLLKGDGDSLTGVTHQVLAAEIGTAREVVSRKLKLFEAKGVIKLSRGRVEIVDRDGLQQLADFSD